MAVVGVDEIDEFVGCWCQRLGNFGTASRGGHEGDAADEAEPVAHLGCRERFGRWRSGDVGEQWHDEGVDRCVSVRRRFWMVRGRS